MSKFWDWVTGKKPEDVEATDGVPPVKTKHGFYDPEIAAKVGTSTYLNAGGEEVVVTAVATDPNHFKKRRLKKKSLRYVGKVTTCVRYSKSPTLDMEFEDDMVDIALWFLMCSDIFNDSYPIDAAVNNVFDGEYMANRSAEITEGLTVAEPVGGSEAQPPEPPPIPEDTDRTSYSDSGDSGGGDDDGGGSDD